MHIMNKNMKRTVLLKSKVRLAGPDDFVVEILIALDDFEIDTIMIN